MLDYQSTLNAMAVRSIMFSPQEYFFVLQVVLGEQPSVAYASVFDVAEFKRNVPSENEDEYLNKFKRDADILLEQQQCKKLRQYLEENYQMDIQEAAGNLSDYRFTGAEIQRLLNNLLKNRTEQLDEASIRDVLSLVKTMFDNGYLDSDEAWGKHFITIPKKYDCICPQCNHEQYLVEGVDNKCSSCGMVFRWGNERFYPQPQKL